MSVLVVTCAFITITQDFVGLGSFFELRCRFLIARMAVRMVFRRKFSISGADFSIRGSSLDSEDLVIVPPVGHVGDAPAVVIWREIEMAWMACEGKFECNPICEVPFWKNGSPP